MSTPELSKSLKRTRAKAELDVIPPPMLSASSAAVFIVLPFSALTPVEVSANRAGLAITSAPTPALPIAQDALSSWAQVSEVFLHTNCAADPLQTFQALTLIRQLAAHHPDLILRENLCEATRSLRPCIAFRRLILIFSPNPTHARTLAHPIFLHPGRSWLQRCCARLKTCGQRWPAPPFWASASVC